MTPSAACRGGEIISGWRRHPIWYIAALLFDVFEQRSDLAPNWIWAAIDGAGPDLVDRLGRLAYDIGTIYGGKEQRCFVAWLTTMIEGEPERSALLGFVPYQPRLPQSLHEFAAAISRLC